MPQIRTIKVLLYSLLFIVAAAAGCGDANDQSFLDPETGKHFDGWFVDHRSAFLVNCTACADCHGADLGGGISSVSCFTAGFNGLSCHPGGFTGHPMPYASADLHGPAAKGGTGCISGFSYCQICHGMNFAGGTSGETCLTALGCHTINAPHSPSPWRSGSRRHTTTHPANGAVCGLCHLGDPANPVYTPLPPGAQPGCFNNTLCHGDED